MSAMAYTKKNNFNSRLFRSTFLEGVSEAINGAGSSLQGLMHCRGVVENYLKWIMITSDYKNENWDKGNN